MSKSKKIIVLSGLLLLALVSSGCVYDPYYSGYYDEYGRYHGYRYRTAPTYRYYDYDRPHRHYRW